MDYVEKWQQESALKIEEFEEVRHEKSNNRKGPHDPNMYLQYLQ